MNELTLFLDTNFLFGILDLHVNPHVQVSHDLLCAIEDYKLPFKLRYHESTAHEMTATIDYYGGVLKSRRWPQTLSRAAVKSRCLSGIEMKYHERNAVTPMEPGVFLKPYEHLDALLGDHGIKIYRPSNSRLHERSDLLNRYEEFLKERNHDKPYESIEHDATVLDTVRMLRSSVASSLEAGSLLVTCDYMLYRFDWETCRGDRKHACTVLPNIFWQIIRPFIPSDPSFDKSFAETFAIPEFRTIGSGATKACSKMMCLLAGYSNVSEETAAPLLTNDLLIDQLRTEDDQQGFAQCVEMAIADDNQALLEERVALAKQIEQEKEARIAAEQKQEREHQEKVDTEKRLALERLRLEQEIADTKRTLDEQVVTFSNGSRLSESHIQRANQDAEKERLARKEAEEKTEQEAKSRKKSRACC